MKLKTLDQVLKEHLPDKFINPANDRLLEKDIAAEMGMTRQGVNLWFRKNQIPIDKIIDLMKFKGNTLVLEDLAPFCPSLLISLTLTRKFPIKRTK